MVFITSYDRPRLLMQLLQDLGRDDVVVIDDGSDYDPDPYLDYCEYYRTPHRGRAGFWMQWDMILEIAEESGDEHFYFLPDDWHTVHLEQADYYLNNVDKPFAFNFTNNGVKANWTPIKRQKTTLADDSVYKVGFVDCGFFCNRKALEKIGFHMEPVPVQRFNRPGISSGVGQQLSNRFMKAWVDMYQPIESLAWHDGSHESKMHPEERKKNPLVPK